MNRTWTSVAVAVVVIVTAGAIWAVADDDDASERSGSSGPELGITLREVTDRPAAFAGREVVVSGDVREVAPDDVEAGGDRGGTRVPASAFSIGGRAQGRQVLVMAPPGESPVRLDPGKLVRVRGVVREFGYGAVAAALERPERIQGRWFRQWEGRPAIIAELIDRTPPAEVDERPPGAGA